VPAAADACLPNHQNNSISNDACRLLCVHYCSLLCPLLCSFLCVHYCVFISSKGCFPMQENRQQWALQQHVMWCQRNEVCKLLGTQRSKSPFLQRRGYASLPTATKSCGSLRLHANRGGSSWECAEGKWVQYWYTTADTWHSDLMRVAHYNTFQFLLRFPLLNLKFQASNIQELFLQNPRQSIGLSMPSLLSFSRCVASAPTGWCRQKYFILIIMLLLFTQI
jgi:hypothetical protein